MIDTIKDKISKHCGCGYRIKIINCSTDIICKKINTYHARFIENEVDDHIWLGVRFNILPNKLSVYDHPKKFRRSVLKELLK